MSKGNDLTEIKVLRSGVVLRKNEQGLWVDKHGTIFAFADKELSVDDEVRLGVGPFKVPSELGFDDAARAHDYCFSSQACQESYTRSESEALLEQHLKLLAGRSWWRRLQAKVISKISKISKAVNFAFWENRRTRWK